MPALKSLPHTLIRGYPDVVPTKVGSHLNDRVPVFTGNPRFPCLPVGRGWSLPRRCRSDPPRRPASGYGAGMTPLLWKRHFMEDTI
jgi:hypothetical protein